MVAVSWVPINKMCVRKRKEEEEEEEEEEEGEAEGEGEEGKRIKY